jgi:hypothetical protein
MNNNELYHFLYERVREILPHLNQLSIGYKKDGMTDEEIDTEICFAIMHEGYKIRCLEEGMIEDQSLSIWETEKALASALRKPEPTFEEVLENRKRELQMK